MPASYRKPGYTWVPYAFLGPANAFLIAESFSGAMHPSLDPGLQARTAGSKSQPSGSKIIPSATPSRASHVFMRVSMNNLRSPSVRNFSICGLPDSSFGAAWLYATGIHSPIARFDRPVRIAGRRIRCR